MGREIEILSREAEMIYKVLLNKKPEKRVVERYIAANKKKFGLKDACCLEKMIERGTDIEALEFAWRIKNPLNILSGKFQIMFYIAEARTENFNSFFNRKNARIAVYFILGFQALRSVLKFIKGFFILKRWKLA